MRWLGFGSSVFLALASSVTYARDTRFVVKVGQYGPRTEVRVARPTLQWQIWAADQTSRVTNVDLRLDGRRVEAQYDSRSRSVKYTPSSALSPGSHKVECRITFEGGAYFDKRWETRVADSPISEFPHPNDFQNESVRITNELRHALGLQPVQQDERLNFASLLHCNYLSQNKATGHGEQAGTPGFLAASGAERLEVYGYTGSSWEDVNFGSQSAAESLLELFNAPYHRIPFMQPGEVVFGSGYCDQRTTLEFGMSSEEGTVVSPADGQTGVPTIWRDYERPNPLRVHGVNLAQTGYPIVFSHFGESMPRIHSVTASLTGPTGEEVECWLNTPENDDELTGAAILIPQTALRPGTRYQATFSAMDESGQPLVKTIRFTTAGAPKKAK